jgi:hypothetical protein
MYGRRVPSNCIPFQQPGSTVEEKNARSILRYNSTLVSLPLRAGTAQKSYDLPVAKVYLNFDQDIETNVASSLRYEVGGPR